MAAALLAEPLPNVEADADLDRLQGTWISVEGRRPVELLIAGKHFTARFHDGTLYMGTFHLFPDERPAEMVMWIDEGPPHHLGRIARSIYAWEVDDQLRWCPADPVKGDRLADFPHINDPRHLCTVFRRQRHR